MAKQYNIFISHSWQYSDTLEALRALLNQRGYFYATYEESTKDNPINSISASYIKQRLGEKIRNSNVILALAGVYATHSEWMQWELDYALANNIPIIGVIPRGQDRVSTVVSTRAKTIVRWNTESLVTAIRTYG